MYIYIEANIGSCLLRFCVLRFAVPRAQKPQSAHTSARSTSSGRAKGCQLIELSFLESAQSCLLLIHISAAPNSKWPFCFAFAPTKDKINKCVQVAKLLMQLLASSCLQCQVTIAADKTGCQRKRKGSSADRWPIGALMIGQQAGNEAGHCGQFRCKALCRARWNNSGRCAHYSAHLYSCRARVVF